MSVNLQVAFPDPIIQKLVINRGATGATGESEDLSLKVSNFSNINPLYVAHALQPLRYQSNSRGAMIKSGDSKLVDALEFDCRHTSDSVLVNNHDATVNAATTSTGNLNSYTGAQFLALELDNLNGADIDNGSGTISIEEAIRTFRNDKILCIEPKESATVAGIITLLQAYNVDTDMAIITSFTLSDLSAVITSGYVAEYLVTDDADIAIATTAGVTRVAISKSASDAQVSAWVSAGFTVGAYTVHTRYERDRLIALGVSAIYTDDVEYLRSNTATRKTDTFSNGQWMQGMLADDPTDYTEGGRGRFDGDGGWGWESTRDTTERDFVLQGWACPIKNDVSADTFSINFDMEVVARLGSTEWGAIHISDDSVVDQSYDSNGSSEERGYTTLIRADGDIQIYRIDPIATSIATVSTPAITDGTTVKFRLDVTPTQIKINRLDSSGSVTHTATAIDSTYRSGYFFLGRSRLAVKFSNIIIT